MARRKINRTVHAASTFSALDDIVIDINSRRSGVHELNGSCVVIIHDKRGICHRYDFSEINYSGQIVTSFAQAFFSWGIAQDPKTVVRRWGFLKVFFIFLVERKSRGREHILTTTQITKAVMSEYVSWLREPKYISKGSDAGSTRPWGEKSQSMHLSIINVLMDWLKVNFPSAVSGKWSKLRRPIRNVEKSIKNRSALPQGEQTRIEKICLEEIDKSYTNFKRSISAIDEVILANGSCEGFPDFLIETPSCDEIFGVLFYNRLINFIHLNLDSLVSIYERKKLIPGAFFRYLLRQLGYHRCPVRFTRSSAYNTILDAIKNNEWDRLTEKKPPSDPSVAEVQAYIAVRHKGVRPRPGIDQALDRCLNLQRKHKSVYKLGNDGSDTEFIDSMVPTSRQLVPYIVLMISRGSWNLQSFGAVPRQGAWKSHPLRPDRIVITLDKNRSKRSVPRSFGKNSLVNVESLLGEMEDLTKNLVQFAPVECRKYLLLFRTDTDGVRAFVDKFERVASDTWYRAFAEFKRNHSLDFDISSLRPSGGELAHQLSDGDIKATAIVLNHGDEKVTVRHYKTPGMKDRNYEKIAGIQDQLVPWANSFSGEVIHSDSNEGPSATQNACTPGFRCKDPYASPFVAKGTKCNAFLGCLTCENTILVIDVRTCARLLQILDALKAAKVKINRTRYDALYREMEQIIESSLLPKFSDDCRSQAYEIVKTFPPMIEIE